MLIETMDVFMVDTPKYGFHVPMRTIAKTGKEPVTIRDLVHEWNKELKKKVNLDVRVRVVICGTHPNNVYHLVENLFFAKEIITTLEVTYECTNEIINNLKNAMICNFQINDLRKFNITNAKDMLVYKFLDFLDHS